MRNRHSVQLALLIGAIIVTGCASTQTPLQSQLDESNGLTWVSMQEAVVLARSAPQYAVAARDYVYIGPIEMNQMGLREHYLWLGMASTVDRDLRGDSAPDAVTLLLLIDGAPLALPLTTWDVASEASLYDVRVPLAGARRARVSLHQIHRIAQADSVEVHLVSDAGVLAHYELWHGSWPNWREFQVE